MADYPGFTVRCYPSFRPARIYRVLVSPDSLYFLRMSGQIGLSDAGHGFSLRPGAMIVSALIRWIGRNSLEWGLAELEGCDPEQLIFGSSKHFKVPAADVVRSSLEPPSMFSGHGHYDATWKLVVGRTREQYQIEDPESLEMAIETLSGLLGPRLDLRVTTRGGVDPWRR